MDGKTGFYFKTDSGNDYFYNDNDGTVSLEENISGETFVFGRENEELIPFNAYNDMISDFLRYNGFSQMLLVVTEKCNLRCKYCIYSGNYDNQREHGMQVMSFEIAKKAIDRFYETQMEAIANNVLHIPLLGFYGGEPLINFPLIKECVAYARELFKDNITFLVTTNGTIMNEEIADFLITNKFAISISLNGDEKENDRLRVFENSKGTFTSIMKSVQLLRERDRDYFSKNVTFIGCYDWKSDLDAVNNFCKSNEYDIPELVRLTLVSDYFTDWYTKFTPEEKKSFFDKKVEIGASLADKLANDEPIEPIERLLYTGAFTEVLNRCVNIPMKNYHPSFMPYSGSCIPGTKICVLPNGTVHCCEKINNTRPIGNVYEGLDIQAINDMLRDYYETMSPICSKCPVKRLCPICFTACLGDDGKFTRSQIGDCKNVHESVRNKFTYVYNLLEKGVRADKLLSLNADRSAKKNEVPERRLFQYEEIHDIK